MNNSINCSGLVDLYYNLEDEFEPYGYSEADARLENSFNISPVKTTGYNEFTDD